MPAVWGGIWLISFINSAIGTALVDSIDAGGFCFFPSVPPNLYGNLIIFIPRSVVFLVIIGLYVRLYLFFRRQSKRAKHTESYTPSDDVSAPWSTPITLDQLSPSSSGFGFGKGDNSTLTTTRRSSVTYAPVYRVDNLGTKLSQYQFKPSGDRKGSKDSQATLVLEPVTSPRARLAVRRSLSRPEMAIPETPEEGITLIQDSEAILNDAVGFEKQLKALDKSVPAMSPRTAHAGFNSPRPDAPGQSQMPDTSGYRFPATVSSSRPAPVLGTEQSSSPATETGIERIKTDASEGDVGLWEALASTEPARPKDSQLGACLTQGRRMSASEENRRASYLMIAYPLAVSVIPAWDEWSRSAWLKISGASVRRDCRRVACATSVDHSDRFPAKPGAADPEPHTHTEHGLH